MDAQRENAQRKMDFEAEDMVSATLYQFFMQLMGRGVSVEIITRETLEQLRLLNHAHYDSIEAADTAIATALHGCTQPKDSS